MESPEQTRCMDALQPLFQQIANAFAEAMAAYHADIAASARADHSDSCAAHNVHNFATKRLERSLAGTPGVHFLSPRGLWVMNVQDVLVASVKKMDGDGNHRSHDSKQQRDFDAQKPLPELPNEAVRLRIGYEPDPAFMSVERVLVVRPGKRLDRWQAQIIDDDGAWSWTDITPEFLPGFGNERARRASGR